MMKDRHLFFCRVGNLVSSSQRLAVSLTGVMLNGDAVIVKRGRREKLISASFSWSRKLIVSKTKR